MKSFCKSQRQHPLSEMQCLTLLCHSTCIWIHFAGSPCPRPPRPPRVPCSPEAVHRLLVTVGVVPPTPAEAFNRLVARYNTVGASKALSEPPFLFFGNVLESGSALVYRLRGRDPEKAGEKGIAPASVVKGLLITSGDQLSQEAGADSD